MNLEHLKPVVDQLVYLNYAHNRDLAPEVSPERWARIYPNAAALEARYQADKLIAKVNYS